MFLRLDSIQSKRANNPSLLFLFPLPPSMHLRYDSLNLLVGYDGP